MSVSLQVLLNIILWANPEKNPMKLQYMVNALNKLHSEQQNPEGFEGDESC